MVTLTFEADFMKWLSEKHSQSKATWKRMKSFGLVSFVCISFQRSNFAITFWSCPLALKKLLLVNRIATPTPTKKKKNPSGYKIKGRSAPAFACLWRTSVPISKLIRKSGFGSWKLPCQRSLFCRFLTAASDGNRGSFLPYALQEYFSLFLSFMNSNLSGGTFLMRNR